MPKRLFDKQDVDALFKEGWKILTADERMTRRYCEEKLAWEVTAKKAESDRREPADKRSPKG